MGILIGIGKLRIGSGSSSWTPLKVPTKIIGWFREQDQVGTEQPNRMDSGATVLTIVSGTGLNKVYQLPAGWVAYDTDYAWWKTDGSLSVTTGTRLVAYDFARTIVKYDNTSPYALREIIILSEALTTAEMNHLRDYAQLSTWWSNTLSDHGYEKTNRVEGQSVWPAESVSDADSDAYIALMTTPPPAGLATLLNKLFVDTKAAGIYYELPQYVLINLHDAQASKLDITPNRRNHTWVGNPTWTAKVGVTIATGKYVCSNFNAAIHGGTKFVLNDCGIVFTKNGTLTGVVGSGLQDNRNPDIANLRIFSDGNYAEQSINGPNATNFTKQCKGGFNFWGRENDLNNVIVRTNGAEQTIAGVASRLVGHASYNTFYFIGAYLAWNIIVPDTYSMMLEEVGAIYAQHGFCSGLDATKRAAFQAIIDQFNIDIQTAF